MRFSISVNGRACTVDVPRSSTLLDVLRDDLGVFSPRFGCGEGRCGSCNVLADGRAVPSCMTGIEEAALHEIVTLEGLGGLADGGGLHPLQEAFIAEDALQCGYCTSGMLMSAAALLARNPQPSEAEIREALAGNLCRCGVHGRIVRAV